MLGAIVMFVIGFRAKRFKWWHAPLLLCLAALAVQLLETRLRGQGFVTGWDWRTGIMVRQSLIDAVGYGVGIWLGIAWAARREMKRPSDLDRED
jgi:hypothetical protein